MTQPRRFFGWKPQKPDFRDRKFTFEVMKLPPSIDYRPECPAVYNQGDLGSCTANAIAFLCEFDWMKEKKPNLYIPSRLFIYYNERVIEGTVDSDSGAELRDGIKSLNKWGFCPESLWPYDINEFAVKPPADAYSTALKEIVKQYGSIEQNQTAMQTALVTGFPIVIGFTVYESFMSEQVASTGIVPMPGPNESVVGGHAVAIVGYNEQGWIVRNSWGTDWGMQGYFIMPYQYFTDPNLASDLWCVEFV